MTKKINKIGFGGGCHWCTEAVFQHVEGVVKVEQGWISSIAPDDSFSEAVIAHYKNVDLKHLIKVHLATHSARNAHSMRAKYRSAIYYFDAESREESKKILTAYHSSGIITKVLPFMDFKLNTKNYLDYFKKHPDSQFCKRYIEPKLEKVKAIRNAGD